MTQALNVMPVPTWNKLRVNFSEKQLFEVNERLTKFENVRKTIPSKVKVAEVYDRIFDGIETGVGQVMSDFVKEHGNDKNYLVIEGKDNLIKFEYMLDEKQSVLIDENKILIKENSKAVIIQRYASNDESVCKHAGQTKIYLEENAEVQFIQVQLFNQATEHFSDIGLYLNKASKASVIRVELGAATVVSGCLANLHEDKTDFSIESLYYGNEKRSLDFNDIARHVGRKTNSVIRAQGALFDESKKIYRGTIDFKKGSKQSVGDESENTMVFSPSCVNKSAPLILCSEDDVEGHHAASIGRIDESLMFYMQTRGFSKEEVRQMMIESNFAPIVAKIPDEELKEEILAFISMIK